MHRKAECTRIFFFWICCCFQYSQLVETQSLFSLFCPSILIDVIPSLMPVHEKGTPRRSVEKSCCGGFHTQATNRRRTSIWSQVECVLLSFLHDNSGGSLETLVCVPQGIVAIFLFTSSLVISELLKQRSSFFFAHTQVFQVAKACPGFWSAGEKKESQLNLNLIFEERQWLDDLSSMLLQGHNLRTPFLDLKVLFKVFRFVFLDLAALVVSWVKFSVSFLFENRFLPPRVLFLLFRNMSTETEIFPSLHKQEAPTCGKRLLVVGGRGKGMDKPKEKDSAWRKWLVVAMGGMGTFEWRSRMRRGYVVPPPRWMVLRLGIEIAFFFCKHTKTVRCIFNVKNCGNILHLGGKREKPTTTCGTY